MSNKRFLKAIFAIAVMAAMLVAAAPLCFAATTRQPDSILYEGDHEGFTYKLGQSYKVETFSYGKRSVGSFEISSVSKTAQTKGEFPIYIAKEDVRFGYSYNNDYKNGEKTKYNLVSDNNKILGGVSLSKKSESGAFVVQRSSDGKNWETVAEYEDFFDQKKLDRTQLYTAPLSDIVSGTYYRVLVGYEMRRCTGTEKQLFGSRDVYTYRNFMEVYSFYLCYDGNPVTFRNIMTGNTIKSGDTVESGFSIDLNETSDKVVLINDAGYETAVSGFYTVYSPGKYRIRVTSPTGEVYNSTITVSAGMSTQKLSSTNYVNTKKEYSTNTSRNYSDRLTQLTIAQTSENSIEKGTYQNITAFGINADSVALFLTLKNEGKYLDNGWEVVSDTWGKKSKQGIDGGSSIGEIGTGGLLIQTSSNGTSWIDVDKGKYAKGLYTTDFAANYGEQTQVLIYTPDGKSITQGVFIRILYVYEAKNPNGKEDNRYVEEYKFYLCSSNLDAVTFHNLSAQEELSNVCEEYDDVTADIYKHAETLLTDSYTVSGFSVDTSLNPTAAFTVTYNGNSLSKPANGQYTDAGRYDIQIMNRFNRKKVVTIYVDNRSDEELLEYYFGDGFLDGKRIYSEGEVPVYEGGLTSWQICAVDEYHLPLSGEIKNISTGTSIKIARTRAEKKETLTEPGTYEASFSVVDNNFESGDNRIFTFRFQIIPEGSAPGPVVNRENLQSYATTTVTDYSPVFYAISTPCATSRLITYAYADKEAALEDAYQMEAGSAEIQEDGSYRYSPTFMISSKEQYSSAWDITDAVYAAASQSVHLECFDLSNEYRRLTLQDDVLADNENLRTLELSKSVIVVKEDQKQKLSDLDALPIINDKPFYFLNPGKNGEVETGYYDFQFIRDEHGWDSATVSITDSNGKIYDIAYEQSVGKQLAEKNCPTGIITITEKTIYGDSCQYDAVYIAEGDNTAKVTLSVYINGEIKTAVLDQSKDGCTFEANAFSIVNIEDEVDPYSMVIVADKEFVTDQTNTQKEWSEEGSYELKIVNRMGYYYKIIINVLHSDYAAIQFEGEGTENLTNIVTSTGVKDLELPQLKRYGYDFIGFEDEQGTLFQDKIAEISFHGTKLLTAVWEAKEYAVIMQDKDGTEISRIKVEYGENVDLPTPEIEKGHVFNGWMKNGELVDGSHISIEEEGDVILTLSTSNEVKLLDKVEKVEDIFSEHIYLYFAVGGVFLLLVIAVMNGLAKRRKKDRR